MITYIRMEAKLIHGQTTTVLRTKFKCDGIIVVDDQLANDPDMKKIYAAAAPAPVKAYFFGIDKGIQQMKKAETSSYNYFVIFRDPTVVAEVLRRGYRFTLPITCGQQFNRADTIAVMQGVGLNPKEIEALNYIETTGTEVVFDPSCKLENKPWSEIKQIIAEKQ